MALDITFGCNTAAMTNTPATKAKKMTVVEQYPF